MDHMKGPRKEEGKVESLIYYQKNLRVVRIIITGIFLQGSNSLFFKENKTVAFYLISDYNNV